MRTPSGHRRISILEVERVRLGKKRCRSQLRRGTKAKKQCVAIYARVSSHEQKRKGDLTRQVQVAKGFCQEQGLSVKHVFKDVARGLNTRRKGLDKLVKLITRGHVDRVVITYKDRLTRFGFEYLQSFFRSYGCKLEVTQSKTRSLSLQEELVEDLIAIVTSFSGRVHGLRSSSNRKRKREKSSSSLS